MAKCPESSRTDDFAELKRQLDVADADIALVNERLDEAQGMQFLRLHLVRGALCQYLTMCVLDADGAAAWRVFGRNLPELRNKPGKVMRLPRRPLKS